MQRSGFHFRFGSFNVSLTVILVAAGLSGCGMSTTAVPSDQMSTGGRISGVAYGGQSPIAGAAIYLYAAGTSGYGGAATSLLNTSAPGVSTDANGQGYVQSDAGGAFSITGDWTCQTPTTQIYLVVRGGNPGLTGTVNNSGIGEMLAMGSCANYSASSVLYINELSTVAAVTALQQFMSSGTVNVSTSSTNTTGLANAFVTAANLISPFSSTANQVTPSGLGAVPYQEMNTLADVLSSCVNTGSPSSTSCGMLFTAATPPGGSAPTDTLQAMLNIAQYPAQNVATLFNLVVPTAPFQPTLAPTSHSNGQPNDWTLAVVYATAPLENYNYPSVDGLAIDSQSNVLVTGNGHVYKFSNAGALLFNVSSPTISTIDYNQALAIDLNDNIWIDDGSYSVTNVSSNGVVNCAPGNNPYCYIPGIGSNYASVYGSLNILNGFGGIAINADNSIWVGTGGALTEINQSGYGLQDYTGTGVADPTSVGIDSVGNFWLSNASSGYGSNGNTIAVVSPAGKAVATYSGGGLNYPDSIAFDHAGNAWVGNMDGFSLTELSPTGVPSANSPISGGGLYFVTDVAVDGLGDVWATSFDTAGLAEFSPAGLALSPSTGFYAGSGSEGNSLAIDSSGNVWASAYDTATINEVVGVAGPTVNPIALARKNGTIGTRP